MLLLFWKGRQICGHLKNFLSPSVIPHLYIFQIYKCNQTGPLWWSIDRFLSLAGSFFITPTRPFSHPNCHSAWFQQRKGFALCPSSIKWGGSGALSVFPSSVFLLLFHQSLSDSCLFPLPPSPLLPPAWPNQPGIEVTIKDEDEQFVFYILPASLRTEGQTPRLEQILFAHDESRTKTKNKAYSGCKVRGASQWKLLNEDKFKTHKQKINSMRARREEAHGDTVHTECTKLW